MTVTSPLPSVLTASAQPHIRTSLTLSPVVHPLVRVSPTPRGVGIGARPILLPLPAILPSTEAKVVSEETMKLAKLEQYRLVCSEVLPYLFVAGVDVAHDLEALQRNGITHIVNVAGLTATNAFPDKLTYLTFNLYDSRDEYLAWFVYEVIDYIHKARQGGGKVLVHCIQGVSRSIAFVIAYLMWATPCDYATAFAQVRPGPVVGDALPSGVYRIRSREQRDGEGSARQGTRKTAPPAY